MWLNKLISFSAGDLVELKYRRIVTNLLDGRSSVRIPLGLGDIFPLQNVQTDAGINLSFSKWLPRDICSEWGRKATGMWCLPFTSIQHRGQEWMEFYLHPYKSSWSVLWELYFCLVNYYVQSWLLVRLICLLLGLTQHNTRRTSIVRRILSSVRLTQYDLMPQHQVNIRKLISECF